METLYALRVPRESNYPTWQPGLLVAEANGYFRPVRCSTLATFYSSAEEAKTATRNIFTPMSLDIVKFQLTGVEDGT